MEEHSLDCTEAPGMPYINKPSLWGSCSHLFLWKLVLIIDSNVALERKLFLKSHGLQ